MTWKAAYYLITAWPRHVYELAVFCCTVCQHVAVHEGICKKTYIHIYIPQPQDVVLHWMLALVENVCLYTMDSAH